MNTRTFQLDRFDLIAHFYYPFDIYHSKIAINNSENWYPPKIDGLHHRLTDCENSLPLPFPFGTEKYFSRVRLKRTVGGARLKTSTLMDRILTRKTRCSFPRKVHGGRHLCPLRCFHYGEHYVTMEEKVGKGIEKERWARRRCARKCEYIGTMWWAINLMSWSH